MVLITIKDGQQRTTGAFGNRFAGWIDVGADLAPIGYSRSPRYASSDGGWETLNPVSLLQLTGQSNARVVS